jgi:hypothetical protein
MELRKLTQFITVSFIAGILVYDIYAYIKGGQSATVSYLVITDWSKNYSAFNFLVGFVMGHLFWPLKNKGGE